MIQKSLCCIIYMSLPVNLNYIYIHLPRPSPPLWRWWFKVDSLANPNDVHDLVFTIYPGLYYLDTLLEVLSRNKNHILGVQKLCITTHIWSLFPPFLINYKPIYAYYPSSWTNFLHYIITLQDIFFHNQIIFLWSFHI